MEQKITQIELAARMAKRTGGTKQDSENFVRLFFETIREGLLQDKLVKVKGLGTFKLIEVSDRESVNVNTGERIRIVGHTKVTFTPDNTLRDQVNRPFAEFETVVLNESTSQQEMERIDKPSVEPVKETVEEKSVAKKEVKKEVKPSVVKPVAAQQEKPVAVQQEKPVAQENLQSEPSKDTSWAKWILILVLLFVVLGLGYYLGTRKGGSIEEPQPAPADTVEQVVVKEPTPEDLAQNYPQVEGGDYWIVGEIGVHEMQVGDGLLRISRKWLGNSDLMQYIVVLNGIENPDVIPPGAKLRIPRLKRKN